MARIINCNGCCTYYHVCKQITEKGGYRLWFCLMKYIYNGRKPKCLMNELVKEARLFLPEYRFFWSGSLCCCETPYGGYVWHFAVRMKQEQIWNYKEFQEGCEYALNTKNPSRESPYQEPSRAKSWDCGYIFGLSKKNSLTNNKGDK